MSMEWIRNQYAVPAKRGMRVQFDWPPESPTTGTIVGSEGGRLLVRLDGNRHSSILHPTWNVTYLPPEGTNR